MEQMAMRKFLVLAALAALSTAAAPPPRTFEVADKPVLDDRFPVKPVLFSKGVKAYRDVTYQQIPGFTPQVVDIYVPAGKGPHPLVLYIHGGGWVGGHTRHSGALANFPAVLASLAAEGFVVASLEYRLSGEAKFPAQLQDAKAALRFLGDHAAHYRIDPARVGVWGGSAGGHLAALTALTCKDTTLDPAAASDLCASTAVTWYGVFDFAKMVAPYRAGDDENAARLLGCAQPCPAGKFAWASPSSYIDGKDPSFLLIHGEEDKVVPVGQSREAEVLLRAAVVPVETIYIPGVDHSFIGATPAQTRTATLQAVNATFDHFHAKLQTPRK
jgi:acetyl esterase/lipase